MPNEHKPNTQCLTSPKLQYQIPLLGDAITMAYAAKEEHDEELDLLVYTRDLRSQFSLV